MYTVKLADGTELKNLSLNGNNYISQTKIEDSAFENNLYHVEITDEETGNVTVLSDVVLIQNKQYGSEWWFILGEKTQNEKQKEFLQGRIEELEDCILELAEIIGD